MEDRIQKTGKAVVDFLTAKPMDYHRSLLASIYKAGVAKNREVIGHCRAWKALRRCATARESLVRLLSLLIELADDREPRRIGQGVEHACQRNIFQTRMSELGHASDIEEDSYVPTFRCSDILN
jgi:hypothetical protein